MKRIGWLYPFVIRFARIYMPSSSRIFPCMFAFLQTYSETRASVGLAYLTLPRLFVDLNVVYLIWTFFELAHKYVEKVVRFSSWDTSAALSRESWRYIEKKTRLVSCTSIGRRAAVISGISGRHAILRRLCSLHLQHTFHDIAVVLRMHGLLTLFYTMTVQWWIWWWRCEHRFVPFN